MSTHSAITPTLSEFQRLARSHDLVPICKSWTADLETPVSAFLRVAYGEPEAFLLESVEGGENVGRYTFMGIRPYKKIIAHGDQITTYTGRTRNRVRETYSSCCAIPWQVTLRRGCRDFRLLRRVRWDFSPMTRCG